MVLLCTRLAWRGDDERGGTPLLSGGMCALLCAAGGLVLDSGKFETGPFASTVQ